MAKRAPDKVYYQVYITSELRQKIRLYAKHTDLSQTDLVERGMTEFLDGLTVAGADTARKELSVGEHVRIPSLAHLEPVLEERARFRALGKEPPTIEEILGKGHMEALERDYQEVLKQRASKAPKPATPEPSESTEE